MPRKSVNVIELSRHIAKTVWTASQDAGDPVYACGIKAVQIVGDANLTDDTFRTLLPMVVVDFLGLQGRRVVENGLKSWRGQGTWRLSYFMPLTETEDQGPNLQIRLTHLFDIWNQSYEDNGNSYLPGWTKAQTASTGIAVFGSQASEMMPLDPFELEKDGMIDNGYVDVDVDFEIFL